MSKYSPISRGSVWSYKGKQSTIHKITIMYVKFLNGDVYFTSHLQDIGEHLGFNQTYKDLHRIDWWDFIRI